MARISIGNVRRYTPSARQAAPALPSAPAPTAQATASKSVAGPAQPRPEPPLPPVNTDRQTQSGVNPFLGETNPYNLPPDLNQELLGNVYSDFQQQREAANRANEQRYQAILGGYQDLDRAYADRTQQLTGLLEGYGQAQREQLESDAARRQAGLQQDLAKRGITATSAVDAQRRGIERDLGYEQRQLDDMLTRQKLQYLTQLTGEELASRPRGLEFMERREDVGPSMQDLQSLAQLSGQAAAPTPDYLGAINRRQGPQQPAGFAGDTPDVPINYDPQTGNQYDQSLTGSNFWQSIIAPQLSTDPNWDWVNDTELYVMAPQEVKNQIDAIRKSRV